MNRNVVINLYTVLTFTVTLITIAYNLYFQLMEGNPNLSILNIIQLMLGLGLAFVGNLKQPTVKYLKVVFNVKVQAILIFIVGSVSSFWAFEAVSSLFPDDPLLFKQAYLMSYLIAGFSLWVMIIISVLFGIFLVIYGVTLCSYVKKKESKQSLFYKTTVSISLLFAIFFGNAAVISELIYYSKNNSKSLVVSSQLTSNNRCTNITKGAFITTASNNEVLVLKNDNMNNAEFIREECELIQDSSTDPWAE